MAQDWIKRIVSQQQKNVKREIKLDTLEEDSNNLNIDAIFTKIQEDRSKRNTREPTHFERQVRLLDRRLDKEDYRERFPAERTPPITEGTRPDYFTKALTKAMESYTNCSNLVKGMEKHSN